LPQRATGRFLFYGNAQWPHADFTGRAESGSAYGYIRKTRARSRAACTLPASH